MCVEDEYISKNDILLYQKHIRKEELEELEELQELQGLQG